MITIDELVPLLKPGFVAKGSMGKWVWFSLKPEPYEEWKCYIPNIKDQDCMSLDMFDIKPFDGDWKDSLIEIKGDKK